MCFDSKKYDRENMFFMRLFAIVGRHVVAGERDFGIFLKNQLLFASVSLRERICSLHLGSCLVVVGLSVP